MLLGTSQNPHLQISSFKYQRLISLDFLKIWTFGEKLIFHKNAAKIVNLSPIAWIFAGQQFYVDLQASWKFKIAKLDFPDLRGDLTLQLFTRTV